MSETTRVRWQCPNGQHPGVLGSRRPPSDSIVRYCLPCSTQTGRLVERIAPALERKRATAAERSAAKAKAKRAREAATRERAAAKLTERYTVEGVDLREEFARLIKLRAFGGKGGRLCIDPPQFDVRCRTMVPGRLGVAYLFENRIIVATYPGQTLADARETLVHELTHLAGRSTHDRAHGREFYRLMDAAVLEAYKVAPKGVRHNSYHGRYGKALAPKAN